jgi:hypothetical protein
VFFSSSKESGKKETNERTNSKMTNRTEESADEILSIGVFSFNPKRVLLA